MSEFFSGEILKIRKNASRHIFTHIYGKCLKEKMKSMEEMSNLRENLLKKHKFRLRLFLW